MLGFPPVSRRTVLGFFGALLSLAFAASAGNAATEGSESTPEKQVVSEVGDRLGIYYGTVDRIVGGEHVVLLVEADGEVIDQHVLPAASYPHLTEGDRVRCARYLNSARESRPSREGRAFRRLVGTED